MADDVRGGAQRLEAIASPGAHASHSQPSLRVAGKTRIPGAHVWVLAALALGSLFATIAHAQQGGQTSSTPPLTGTTAPSGNCGVGSLYVNTTTGDLYDCSAGAWNKVTGGGGGSGTVTSFSSGNLSPLFTTSVATPTSTPALSFSLSNAGADSVLGNCTGSSAAPSFCSIIDAMLPASVNSCSAHQWMTAWAAGASVTCSQPTAADIGSIPGSSGQLLFNNAGAIGAEDPVISYSTPAESTAAWTSGTAGNTAVSVNIYTSASNSSLSFVRVTLNQGSTITGGVVTFEGSDTTAFTNAYQAYCWQMTSGTLVGSYTLVQSANQAFECPVPSWQAFRVRLSTTISGTGTVNVGVQPSAAPSHSFTTVQGTVGISGTVPVSAASLPLPSGAATSANQCGASSPCEVSKDTSANSATDPLFAEPTDGTAAMGAMANFGTSPGAVKALNTNASCFVGTTACPNDGTAGVQAVGGHLSDNGAAAAANRTPQLPGIYQTDYRNGTAGTQGDDAAAEVGTDGLLWTAQLPAIRPASYHTSANFAASSTTDNFVFPGNASNTVLITKVTVSCTQTTAGIVLMKVIKRSAADTSGTSSAVTPVPDDSNYSAAVSAPLSYTGTGPTVGTAVGTVDEYYLGCLAAGTASPNDIYVLNLRQKPIVLRGTAQQLAINFNNSALTGGNLNVTVEHIETKTITP